MKRTVKPYQVDGSPDAAALRARDIPVVTPPPPPDDSAGAPARDAQRRADLQQIALLLERYRAQFGSYPSAPNPQSLCVYAADAGCALEKVGPIPRDPRPGWNYAYWSTGPAEYLLISRLEASPESCAVSIPVAIETPGAHSVLSSRRCPKASAQTGPDASPTRATRE